jgi:hypothetical protein
MVAYFIFSTQNFFEVVRKYVLYILGVSVLFLIFIFNSFLPYFSSERVVSRSDFILNLWYVPVSSISKILYPFPSHFYNLSFYLFSSRYNIEVVPQLIVDSFAVESLATQISLVLVIFTTLLFVIKKFRAIANLPLIYFSLLFYVSHILIFTLDNSTTGLGFLESRHYFPSHIGIGIIFIIIVVTISNMIFAGSLFLRNFVPVILLSIIILLHSQNISYNNLSSTVKITSGREALLSFISKEIPTKSKSRLIIYVEENHPFGHTNVTGQYFQTGFLYPYLVYVYKDSEFSHKLFETDILWDYNFQGVYETDETSVGYYFDSEKLRQDYKDGLFLKEDLYAVRFDYYELERKGELTNSMLDISKITPQFITDEIRYSLELGSL